jgi:hypothetical protein
MILIKLILAHLIGDFILQPTSWVKEKQQKKLASLKLYFHIFIHFGLTWLLLWDLSKWYLAAIIAVSHFLIDSGKLYLQNQKNKRLLFFLDQLLHFIILFLVWYFWYNPSFQFEFNPEFFIFITAALFLTKPASVIIKTFISVYKPQTEIKNDESLTNAGNYIGILERLLVFIFIITGHWEGVGFLIAAKSIFRFSDLSQSKDRKLTEYILIGTLLSFGMAIIVGIITT